MINILLWQAGLFFTRLNTGMNWTWKSWPSDCSDYPRGEIKATGDKNF